MESRWLPENQCPIKGRSKEVKRLLYLIVLLSFSAVHAGGDRFSGRYNARLMKQRPVPKGDFNRLVLPVKNIGNLIIVEAVVDGIRGI